MRQVFKFVVLIVLFSASVSVCAKQDRHIEGLTLTPSLCLMASESKFCRLSIEASWKTKTKDNYCLFTDQEAQPLACWNNSNQEQINLSLTLSNDVVISLRATNSGELKYSEKISLQKSIKKYRKRRRNPWQFY